MPKTKLKNDDDSEVDSLVGRNIRLRRRLLGMTQGDLARHLGLTFQQVQKYERGANRVAASTLWRVAGGLNCGVEDLFEGAAPPATAKIAAGGGEIRDPASMAREVVAADGGYVLAGAFLGMSPGRRRALVAAARALAKGDDEAGAKRNLAPTFTGA